MKGEAPLPLMSVVAGSPTAEELAAITAVFATRTVAARQATPAPVGPVARWALPTRAPAYFSPTSWQRAV